MSKYFNDGIATVSFVADEDLTTYQYKTVALTASGGLTVERCTGASRPTPIGILQNDPSAGQEASVKVIGFTKATARVSSCYLAPGVVLFGASDGVLQPASGLGTASAFIARWCDEKRTTADASYIGNVLLFGWCAGSGVTF